MKRLFNLTKFAACCSCAVMLMSPAGVFADQGLPAPPKASTVKTAEVKTIRDVELAAGGTFKGQVLNAEGLALGGVDVTLYQGTEEIARTVTNQEGQFAVSNLRGGVYQVNAENTQENYRLWSEDTAPPTAQEEVAIVSSPKVVRGQIGGIDFITATALAAAITGVTFAIINHSELDDANDKLDALLASP